MQEILPLIVTAGVVIGFIGVLIAIFVYFDTRQAARMERLDAGQTERMERLEAGQTARMERLEAGQTALRNELAAFRGEVARNDAQVAEVRGMVIGAFGSGRSARADPARAPQAPQAAE